MCYSISTMDPLFKSAELARIDEEAAREKRAAEYFVTLIEQDEQHFAEVFDVNPDHPSYDAELYRRVSHCVVMLAAYQNPHHSIHRGRIESAHTDDGILMGWIDRVPDVPAGEEPTADKPYKWRKILTTEGNFVIAGWHKALAK